MPNSQTMHRRGPLDTVTPPPAFIADVAIDIAPPAGRFVVWMAHGQAPAGRIAGFELAVPLNRFASHEGCHALRLGPDEWLLIAEAPDADALQREITSALAGQQASVVDVSHRQVALEISGDAAALVLNAGCPLDLAPAAFPVGMATRTLLGKVEIVLMKVSDEPRYRIEVWRSFARHLHAFLIEAAAGCGD